jgi:hypothetical protein
VPGGPLVNGPYCDPTVQTCPGQAPAPNPDSNSLFQPGPASTDTSAGSGSDASGGSGTDTSGSSSTDTSGGSSGDTSGSTTDTSSSDTSSGDAQLPATDSSASPAPAGAGGASSTGGKGQSSNSLFGNSPLPAADAPPTTSTETSLNIWAIVGAGLIVLAVVLSHVISTLRQRGRRRAAQTA